MKPIGKPRENVEKMDNKNQEKELIAKAGLELTDDGLGMVAGGANTESSDPKYQEAVQRVSELTSILKKSRSERDKKDIVRLLYHGHCGPYSLYDIAIKDPEVIPIIKQYV